MPCRQCGYILQPFEQTCPKCARLGRTTQIAPGAASQTPPNNAIQAFKVCPRCSQPAVLTMSACGRCGHPYPVEQERKSREWLVPVLGMGFALLCVVVAVVVVSDPRRKSLSLPNFNGASGLTSTIGKQIDSRLTRSLATVGGELEVSLMWDTLSDLDLQVKDPTGDKVEAEHPRSNSGGEQDVDANPTPLSLDGTIKVMRGIPPGVEALEPIPEYRIDARESQDVFGGMGLGGLTGQAPGKYTRTPIEHIFYAKAPRGEYIVYARCYSWREPNSNPLPFVIQVRSNGRVLKEVKATIGPSNYVADGVQPTEICRVTLP